jgi:outer membrane protein assembly factor BamB
MDKKTEMALQRQKNALSNQATTSTATTAVAAKAAAVVAPTPTTEATPSGWWMYHGDPAHTGYVSDSSLNSKNVGSATFTTLFTLELGGPVLSVPAVVDGFVYVGIANSQQAQGGNGGALHKIDVQTGKIVSTYSWDLGNDLRDTHSFTGMGSTPAIINGRVYFGAFNGKFYCLDQEDLSEIWFTDLRNEDILHNQPITNNAGVLMGLPAAVIWSSPVLSADGSKVYVGCGEGESPELYSFVYCLDTNTGNIVWIFCTNQFVKDQPNQPNDLPAPVVLGTLPPQFTSITTAPIVMGSSVWGSIAYDKVLNRLYCSTGNQQPEANQPGSPLVPELPSPGYSNGLLSLDADTGEFRAFFQVPFESNYRVSDTDIDVGGAPILFDIGGKRVVCFGCKNGTVFVLDPDTLESVNSHQLLPYQNGTWIPTVDPHPIDGNAINPHVSNEESNSTAGENYSGVFNTPAYYPGSDDNPQTISPRLFLGMGGPNYHNASPGIDFESTPFMRAIDANTLLDAWPVDSNDPPRYKNAMPPMYTNAGECGLSSPAVVNDVVFCTTSKVSIYAFDIRDGTLLWQDDLGMQTDGYNGGYGYCLGPAIWKNYVVAGALVFGRDGGVLRIYGLTEPQS